MPGALEAEGANSQLSQVLKSTSSLLSRPKPKPKNSGPLTREEKAAKDRASLFRVDDDDPSSGGMALARAQLRTEAKSHGGSGIASSSKTPANGRPSLSAKPKLVRPQGSTSSSRPPPATARDRLKAGFDATSFVRLNTEKRDRRTIEEIERDMKARQTGASSTSGRPTLSPAKRRPADEGPGASKRAKPSSAPQKSRRGEETSSEEEESEEERPRRRKEHRGFNVYEIMGRNRQTDMQHDVDSDDDDMEASGADVLREEQRAYGVSSVCW